MHGCQRPELRFVLLEQVVQVRARVRDRVQVGVDGVKIVRVFSRCDAQRFKTALARAALAARAALTALATTPTSTTPAAAPSVASPSEEQRT